MSNIPDVEAVEPRWASPVFDFNALMRALFARGSSEVSNRIFLQRLT